jgi:hypothetical protein
MDSRKLGKDLVEFYDFLTEDWHKTVNPRIDYEGRLTRRYELMLDERVKSWDGKKSLVGDRELSSVFIEQHKLNFLLWHEEDLARRKDVGDSVIAQVKRNIDGFNQKRNNNIEEIDEYLLGYFERHGTLCSNCPQNSETLGNIIDRLSILTLKIFHMREQVQRNDASEDHKIKCRQKLSVLALQREDLVECFSLLFEEILSGRRKHQVYRQYKMYNDPSLNPAVYKHDGKKG